MKPVAPGDEVTLNLLPATVRGETHPRSRAGKPVQDDIRRLPHDGTGLPFAFIRQMLLDLGLAIDQHTLARETLQVDAMLPAFESQLETVVNQALAPHDIADAGLSQQLHGSPLQKAGADTRLHMGAGMALQHDGFDAVPAQQQGQHQARGSAADDDDLGSKCGYR